MGLMLWCIVKFNMVVMVVGLFIGEVEMECCFIKRGKRFRFKGFNIILIKWKCFWGVRVLMYKF